MCSDFSQACILKWDLGSRNEVGASADSNSDGAVCRG